MFLHLGAIYGHIWLSQFQNEGFLDLVKKEWGETLHGIEDRNLSLPLDVCKQQETMPPTLPKFYRLCCSFKKTETPSEVEMTRDALIDVEHECAHWEKILTLASEKDQNNVIKNFQQFLSSAQQRRIKIKKQFNATQKPKKKTNNIGG